MPNKLISAMIGLVIGLALLPVVNQFATDLTKAPKTEPTVAGGIFYNTAVGSLINLLPILYVILLIVGITAYIRIKK